MMKRILLFLFVAVVSVQCKKDDGENQSEIDEKIISAYIADNGLDAQNVGGGLYFVDEQTGAGESPTASSTVKVAYRGYFTNGQVFDESSTDGVAFGLNQVIRGWTLGIPYFKEGGRGKLLIPSGMAYGANPPSGIPQNSVLIFDIHLIEVL
ncbi:FKBP-type peptidyl-prolyl cis-trans isomerase [Cryomorpha ignava]|nr:FKBP-type peptidyl-prolyl cis-trans isomerase [Cryomorpha ignava]